VGSSLAIIPAPVIASVAAEIEEMSGVKVIIRYRPEADILRSASDPEQSFAFTQSGPSAPLGSRRAVDPNARRFIASVLAMPGLPALSGFRATFRS
jgi:hypothetical protein